MSVEDKDNLYILEEEEQDQDSSPLNFAAYNDEERASVEEVEEQQLKRVSIFGILLKIMFSPVEGWKLLRRSNTSLENLQSSCFYPLLALVAISKFADYFYSVNVGLTQLVSKAVVAFVSYFFGYFCIQIVMAWLLPKDMAEKIDTPFGRKYIIISLSTLAIFSFITDLVPMLWPILIFLPIWTLYIMFKGVRFFNLYVKQEMKFYIIVSAAVIAIPLLIDSLLNGLLPY